MQPAFDFDAATVLNKGRRNYQEDAIISDFAKGTDMGVAVMSDGMGGHAAGDVASKIVVTEVFSELLFRRCHSEVFRADAQSILTDAAKGANACLRDHVRTYPDTHGMGATLVATVFFDRHLHWISIGDSPLFLFRDGELTQLNEDHSMAPQIDFMAKSGLISEEDASCHPDRNTLTSVLYGEDIPKIDCPAEPLEVRVGDILIVASDGLQFLSNTQIKSTLLREQHQTSAGIADCLMGRVLALNEPDLDNVSFAVIKLRHSLSDLASSEAALQNTYGIHCVG